MGEKRRGRGHEHTFSIAAAESLRTRGGADMPSCAAGGELPSADAGRYPAEIAERG